jgi:hypothetical protein
MPAQPLETAVALAVHTLAKAGLQVRAVQLVLTLAVQQAMPTQVVSEQRDLLRSATALTM